MQAIVGLSRGLSRAFVNGVVSRSQSASESSQTAEDEHRLGEKYLHSFVNISRIFSLKLHSFGRS